MTQPEAMLLSLVIETPIALGLGRAASPQEPSWSLFAVALAGTLITHPFAWSGVPALAPWLGTWGAFAVVEVAVALVEGALYARVGGLGWRWGLAVGVVSNATSAAYGVLASFGWLPG